ncbi:MAG: mannose-1-phosphate guanylyltransferase/mannose-6-phosphate isomerase [Synergistaceae bacterium]|jgi:mannose-1-phosphate guanylyltransferase/mannose-6-phosphate isomerase|nr:mannose-1-phosphate guanylyltransferase/mannose-6-phosphate isomerase [Synergistaceae bacterium]
MTEKLHVLILAGGSGTRLWPLSREEMPKQFLSVCGLELTLLQQTASRMAAIASPDRLHVVASGKWKPLINHQLAGIGLTGELVIEEPEGRNTAPAIALGVASLMQDGASVDDLVIVCPSDHIIRDEAEFSRAVKLAEGAASAGSLVTFGIKPTSPETGFGYIKTIKTSNAWLDVDHFVEKPDARTAEGYLESGDYYWNGGIFCFRISDIVGAFSDYFPEISPIFNADRGDLSRWFLASPSQSIDYAIMEKVRNIVCVPLDAGWSDVGSWDSVFDNSPRDGSNNATAGNVRLQGGRESLVVGHDRLICGVDLDSMIVVDTPDALFISPRGSSQKLRDVVRGLSDSNCDEVSEAPLSARQWGVYKVLSKGARHKIKHLEVSPGRSLSLQYHLHRSEHWVVVRGTARVTVFRIGDDGASTPRLIHEGESVFVPKGYMHRLENPGKVPLEIIEVQIGEYVGEDDIERVG